MHPHPYPPLDSAFHPAMLFYHNRNKFLGRQRLLLLYLRKEHCSVRSAWQLYQHHCCGGGGPPWPIYRLDRDYQTSPCGLRPPVDLTNVSELERLGIAQQLADGNASYMRPEPGRPVTRVYLYQKEEERSG